MPVLPSVRIVVPPAPGTPGLAGAMARLAMRWQAALAAQARTTVADDWRGEPADVLIAMHARHAAAAVARFAHAHPGRGLALVLVGGDVAPDLGALAAVSHATHLVALQPRALAALGPAQRSRARVILPSTTRRIMRDKTRTTFDVTVLSPLCEASGVPDLLRALDGLPEGAPVRVFHLPPGATGASGSPGDATCGALIEPEPAVREQALALAARRSTYTLDEQAGTDAARRRLARSRLLVEPAPSDAGGACIVDAIRSHVPVLASAIDAHLGLLGEGYGGFFAPGDAQALGSLLMRSLDDPVFHARLASRCAMLEPAFRPEAETAAVRSLLADLLG